MTILIGINKSITVNTYYRIIFSIIIGLLFSFSSQLTFAQQGVGEKQTGKFLVSKDSVLSAVLQKEVVEFFTSYPEMVKEIFPFEQKCIAGIKREAKECEEAVRGQLDDFKDEIKLSNRRAQVNTERAQVKIHQEMIDNIKIVVAVIGINNILHGLKDGELQETLSDLKKINNSQLNGDIDEVIKTGSTLLDGGKVSRGQAEKMQSILLSRSGKVLSIYQGLPSEEQKKFTSIYTMALGAPKYIIK